MALMLLVFSIPLNLYAQEEDEEEITDEIIDESQDSNVSPEGILKAVKDFDVSGFKIGMNYKQIIDTVKSQKYIIKKITNEIPEYIKYNFDDLCQKRKIFLVESLNECVKGLAKKSKDYYVNYIEMEKPSTNEKINLFLTSNTTENLVYRIEYKIDLMTLRGDQKKYLYIREENRRAYWFAILEKYGKPNDEPNKWIYNQEDEFSTRMQASFDGILLENKGMKEIDFVENVKKARNVFKPEDFTF
jgi:hypothetical protein